MGEQSSAEEPEPERAPGEVAGEPEEAAEATKNDAVDVGGGERGEAQPAEGVGESEEPSAPAEEAPTAAEDAPSAAGAGGGEAGPARFRMSPIRWLVALAFLG